MHCFKVFALFVAPLLLSAPSYGATREGVHFPEQLSVEGRPLHLNGVGLLQKTIFKIAVYVAGLYLQKPAQEEREILASQELKKVVMVFLRDVSSNQIADEWRQAFQKTCDKSCGALLPEITQFTSMLTNVHRGQEIRFTFYQDHLGIESEGLKTAIPDPVFARAFLSTFIGKNAAEEDVRRGLLSLNKG